jgi:hypothetical protein
MESTHDDTEETLVPDPRAGLTPAQMVEAKLIAMLGSTPLPVSVIREGNIER